MIITSFSLRAFTIDNSNINKICLAMKSKHKDVFFSIGIIPLLSSNSEHTKIFESYIFFSSPKTQNDMNKIKHEWFAWTLIRIQAHRFICPYCVFVCAVNKVRTLRTVFCIICVCVPLEHVDIQRKKKHICLMRLASRIRLRSQYDILSYVNSPLVFNCSAGASHLSTDSRILRYCHF